MVAVGNLLKVWVDFPGEFADMESLACRFEQFFGKGWGEVMVGGEMPFSYHLGWEAYFAVAGLSRSAGPVLSTLLGELKGRGVEVYNIIAG